MLRTPDIPAERAAAAVSHRIERFAGLIGLVLVAIGIASVMIMISRQTGWPADTDTGVYLKAAKSVLAGQNPYVLVEGEDPYPYPPFLALLVGLISQVIGYGKLWILWPCLSIGLVGGCALLLRSFGRIIPDGWLLFAVGLILCSRLVRSDLFHGQINILMLFAILLGLRYFLNGATLRGATTWACVVVCKPFMGVLIFYLLCRKGWRAAALTAGIAAVLFFGPFFLISTPVEGVRGWLAASTFLTMLPMAARPDHQSLPALAKRIFVENPFSVPWIDAPVAAQVVSVLAAALAVLVFVVAVASRPGREDAQTGRLDAGQALAEIGLTVALALSCGPLLEGDHLILIWPALYGAVLCAQRAEPQAGTARGRWIVAAALWCTVFWVFALPKLPYFVAAVTWPVLEGPQILMSGRNGILVFLACLATSSALRTRIASREPGAPIALAGARRLTS
jgi:hypothetical protein